MKRFFSKNFAEITDNLQNIVLHPGARKSARVAFTSVGFTIVELLIVIVIIGILAAIVIVAYNGITVRAENNKTITGVGEYVKGLQMYAVQNGHYPIHADYPCLGPHPGTSCGRVGSGDYCLGSGSTTSKVEFDDEMKSVLGGTVPSVSTQVMSCGTVTGRGAYLVKNDTASPAGSTAVIYYFLNGDQPCSGIGGVQSFVKQQTDNTTQCRATLPTV